MRVPAITRGRGFKAVVYDTEIYEYMRNRLAEQGYEVRTQRSGSYATMFVDGMVADVGYVVNLAYGEDLAPTFDPKYKFLSLRYDEASGLYMSLLHRAEDRFERLEDFYAVKLDTLGAYFKSTPPAQRHMVFEKLKRRGSKVVRKVRRDLDEIMGLRERIKAGMPLDPAYVSGIRSVKPEYAERLIELDRMGMSPILLDSVDDMVGEIRTVAELDEKLYRTLIGMRDEFFNVTVRKRYAGIDAACDDLRAFSESEAQSAFVCRTKNGLNLCMRVSIDNPKPGEFGFEPITENAAWSLRHRGEMVMDDAVATVRRHGL